MSTAFLATGLVASILGLALSVLAISSSLWVRIRYPFLKNDIGLMRHCDVDSDYCGDMDQLYSILDIQYTALFRSVQALYLLHCVGLLISTCMYVLYIVRFFENKGQSFRVLAVFNFVTLGFGLYGVCMFATHYMKFFGLTHNPLDDEIASLDRAFYVAVAGCCLTLLVTIFSALEASEAAGILHQVQRRITVWSTPYTLFVEQENC